MPKVYSEAERAQIDRRLREEAVYCLGAFGVKGTTVDLLVKRVNIPKGTFYLFYSSKELLLFRAMLELHEQMEAALIEQLEALPDKRDVDAVTDAIVGLSARCEEMLEYVKTADMSLVDYLGVGPLHETATKKDAGLTSDGSIVTQDFDDLRALHEVSPRPIVVGGGVKAADLPALKATGVEGFFVVSAVCSAPDPHAAAAELVETWRQA